MMHGLPKFRQSCGPAPRAPIERPKVAPKPAAPPADDDGGFSLKHGFGADEFNFAKMLDDPPTDSKSDDTADPDAN